MNRRGFFATLAAAFAARFALNPKQRPTLQLNRNHAYAVDVINGTWKELARHSSVNAGMQYQQMFNLQHSLYCELVKRQKESVLISG